SVGAMEGGLVLGGQPVRQPAVPGKCQTDCSPRAHGPQSPMIRATPPPHAGFLPKWQDDFGPGEKILVRETAGASGGFYYESSVGRHCLCRSRTASVERSHRP